MKTLTNWTPEKADAHRQHNAESLLHIHLVLDESPSMRKYANNLIEAAEYYLHALRDDGLFWADIAITLFSGSHHTRGPWSFAGLPGIDTVYDARRGDGTAIVEALYALATRHGGESGQHMLLVFTDGEDNMSDPTLEPKLRTLLESLQSHESWLCVFLGAYSEALQVGVGYGFAIGNCLVFPSRDIPEAFEKVLRATRRYLAERKKLPPGQKHSTTQFFLAEHTT